MYVVCHSVGLLHPSSVLAIHRIEMNLRHVMTVRCSSSAYTFHTSRLQVSYMQGLCLPRL
ncbi:hypothetical protein M378DRAFT_173903 [Amanita muscaria Koide BX008]|uniref:Uncharacterized protein n=1 Tax=Amanita muscaria (strain Koide BX008) TaxID=946122 RepID=A0A0C2WG22_AMAMK|nr:hypothetical protein M378DRAFT_173903 [Amanita muscaria Koide BX008]